MKKSVIIILSILIVVFLFKFAIVHRYQWDSKSPEYALYQLTIAGLTGDKYLKEAYISEDFYKQLAIRFGFPVTPEMLDMVKTTWLNGTTSEKAELDNDDIVKKELDYAFSHIKYLKKGTNKDIKLEKHRIFVFVKPKLVNDIIDYAIIMFLDKNYEYDYTLKREAYGWKLIKYDTKVH